MALIAVIALLIVGTNGMIATFTWQAGAHISDPLDLVVMNADGSGVTRIATSSGIDTEPRWTADGWLLLSV